MDKRQLIDSIRSLNPSTSATFLGQFDASSLRDYLNRLESVRRHETLIAEWVRPRRKAS
jgi:hypothetical protein